MFVVFMYSGGTGEVRVGKRSMTSLPSLAKRACLMRHHRPLSAKGALSAPQPMMLEPPQRSEREAAAPKRLPPPPPLPLPDDADPYQPSPLRPSMVTAHLSRMNFPSLYFWLFSAASS